MPTPQTGSIPGQSPAERRSRDREECRPARWRKRAYCGENSQTVGRYRQGTLRHQVRHRSAGIRARPGRLGGRFWAEVDCARRTRAAGHPPSVLISSDPSGDSSPSGGPYDLVVDPKRAFLSCPKRPRVARSCCSIRASTRYLAASRTRRHQEPANGSPVQSLRHRPRRIEHLFGRLDPRDDRTGAVCRPNCTGSILVIPGQSRAVLLPTIN